MARKPSRRKRTDIALLTQDISTPTQAKVSVQVIERALRLTCGSAKAAAKLIGKKLNIRVSEHYIRTKLREYPELARARHEAQGNVLDCAVDNLAEGIMNGDRTYTLYYLKEFSKDIGNNNGQVFDFSRRGLTAAEKVIDYSQYTDEELALLQKLAKKREELENSESARLVGSS